MGLIDVGYVLPHHVAPDYQDMWGVDDLPCLSRYDGLLYIRLNALGAYILGFVKDYSQPQVILQKNIKVLANMDLVVTEPPISPADKLFLHRVAEIKSENVWSLDKTKLQQLLEQGFDL